MTFCSDKLEKKDYTFFFLFHLEYTNSDNVRITYTVSVSKHLVVSCSLTQQHVFAFGYRMLQLSR